MCYHHKPASLGLAAGYRLSGYVVSPAPLMEARPGVNLSPTQQRDVDRTRLRLPDLAFRWAARGLVVDGRALKCMKEDVGKVYSEARLL
jgi:hypothetical protein